MEWKRPTRPPLPSPTRPTPAAHLRDTRERYQDPKHKQSQFPSPLYKEDPVRLSPPLVLHRHHPTQGSPPQSSCRVKVKQNTRGRSPAARRLIDPPVGRSDGATVERVAGGVGGAAAAGGAQVRRRRRGRQGRGAAAVAVAGGRRAAVVPVVPAVGVHGPLGPGPRCAVLAPLPAPRRGRPGHGALPPRLPPLAPPLRRRRAGLALGRLGRQLPVPLLLLPPHRPPPPALPRQAPLQQRPRPAQLHGAPRLLLPPPRLPRRALLRRRGRLQGLVVRHLRRPRPLLRQRRPQRRPRLLPRDGLLDVPQRHLPPHLRPLPPHLPPPGPPPRGLRRLVARRGRGRQDGGGARPQGAPRHPQAAQGHQPPLPQVHRRRAAHRHRQPVRLRAPHHAPRFHRRPPPHRRARAMFSCTHVRAHHNPEQRRQDHSPSAGAHGPDHQVARLLHHRAGPGRRDRPWIQPELHAGRVPRGRERLRVQRGDRRRGHAGEHQVPPASHARDLLPEEAGTSDVPGEQQGRHHRVRVHAGPVVPPHHLHARVDALPVAAGENSRFLMNTVCISPFPAQVVRLCFFAVARLILVKRGGVGFFCVCARVAREWCALVRVCVLAAIWCADDPVNYHGLIARGCKEYVQLCR